MTFAFEWTLEIEYRGGARTKALNAVLSVVTPYLHVTFFREQNLRARGIVLPEVLDLVVSQVQQILPKAEIVACCPTTGEVR